MKDVDRVFAAASMARLVGTRVEQFALDHVDVDGSTHLLHLRRQAVRLAGDATDAQSCVVYGAIPLPLAHQAQVQSHACAPVSGGQPLSRASPRQERVSGVAARELLTDAASVEREGLAGEVRHFIDRVLLAVQGEGGARARVGLAAEQLAQIAQSP